MDFDKYKKTCELYSCYYRMKVGFQFVIFFKSSFASITFYKDGTVFLDKYISNDLHLYNKIKKGKTKEELDELLFQILKYEFLKLRKIMKLNNFSEEVYYHFARFHKNVSDIIQETINEIFKTNVMPYEINNNYRIRFLLNSNLPIKFDFIKDFISFYKFIKDDTFIKI